MMDQNLLLKIARRVIINAFERSSNDFHEETNRYPELLLPRATFVTLTLNGALRGCIGSIIAQQPLIDDLISNAYSAAFRDPRFLPLSPTELPDTIIEVSLLSEPQAVYYEDKSDLMGKIEPGKDGVILRHGNRQATFLPQVWDELSDFESFFAHLGMKAGIGSDPLLLHPDVYTYQVEKIKEH